MKKTTDRRIEFARRLHETSPIIKKSIFLLLFFAALICAVIGSFDWCKNGLGQDGWILASSTFMSTLDLFVFSPGISISDMGNAPVAYLVAMWLAPIFTATAILKLIDTKLCHIRVLLLARLFKHIIIFDFNENSCALIQNLLDNDHLFQAERIMLVCETPLDQEKQVELEKRGIAVLTLPIIDASAAVCRASLRLLGLSKASAVALMYDNALDNYAILCRLVSYTEQMTGKMRSIPCAFLSDNPAISNRVVSQQKEHDGRSVSLEIKPLSVSEIAARELFGLSDYNTLKQGHSIWENAPNNSGAQRNIKWDAENLRILHLLIVGMDGFGEGILRQAVKLGVSSPETPMHITILDKRAGEIKEKLYALYPQLDKLCALHIVESDVYSSAWQSELKASAVPITYAAVCLRDTSAGLWVAQELIKQELILPYAPVGVRADDKAVILGSLSRYTSIFTFGQKKDILTRENVFLEALDNKARRFYYSYAALADRLQNTATSGNCEKPDWYRLSYIKKESTRAQAEYFDFIKLLCGRLNEKPNIEAIMADVESAGSHDGLKEENRYAVRLAMLEHTRWCKFYYLNAFRLGAAKDEENKIHNCLIDDWFEMLNEEQYPGAKGTMKYDLIPILLAFEEDGA